MKKTVAVILIMMLFTGCDDPWFLEKRTNIEGLNLEFHVYGRPLGFNIDVIHFVNEQTGYFAGGLNLCKTDDGGETWTRLNAHAGGAFTDIYFVNDLEGFAVANGTYCSSESAPSCNPTSAVIFHTKDGGQTWKETSMPTTFLNSIWFNSETSGFAVNAKSIFATNDGGDTWTEVIPDIQGEYLGEVQFINHQKGFITTTTGKLLTTTDGGKTWNILGPFFSTPGRLYLVREDLIFFATSFKIYRSFDLGHTWNEFANAPTTTYTRAMMFVSEDVGYAVGGEGSTLSRQYGSIYYTTDGGVTWKGTNRVRETSPITVAHFPTPAIGYAGSGSILIKIRKE